MMMFKCHTEMDLPSASDAPALRFLMHSFWNRAKGRARALEKNRPSLEKFNSVEAIPTWVHVAVFASISQSESNRNYLVDAGVVGLLCRVLALEYFDDITSCYFCVLTLCRLAFHKGAMDVMSDRVLRRTISPANGLMEKFARLATTAATDDSKQRPTDKDTEWQDATLRAALARKAGKLFCFLQQLPQLHDSEKAENAEACASPGPPTVAHTGSPSTPSFGSPILQVTSPGLGSVRTPGSTWEEKTDIVVSYHRFGASHAQKICSLLRSTGFSVKLVPRASFALEDPPMPLPSLQKMSSSKLAATRGTIQSARVVLACLSPGYQRSLTCRWEWVVATARDIPIIPLLLPDATVETWTPGAWLRPVLSRQVLWRFSNDQEMQVQLDSFKRAARRIMNSGGSQESRFLDQDHGSHCTDQFCVTCGLSVDKVRRPPRAGMESEGARDAYEPDKSVGTDWIGQAITGLESDVMRKLQETLTEFGDQVVHDKGDLAEAARVALEEARAQKEEFSKEAEDMKEESVKLEARVEDLERRIEEAMRVESSACCIS